MNYWQRWIGAWRKKTTGLTLLQRGAYSELLDAYYANERALPMDRETVYRMVGAFNKAEQSAVDSVLANPDFFHENGGDLHNDRADEEIKKWQVFCEDQRRRRMGIKKPKR